MQKNLLQALGLAAFMFTGLAVTHLVAATYDENVEERYAPKYGAQMFSDEIMGEPVTDFDGTDQPFDEEPPEAEMEKEISQ